MNTFLEKIGTVFRNKVGGTASGPAKYQVEAKKKKKNHDS